MDFIKMGFYIGGGVLLLILAVLVIVIWVLSIIIAKLWEKLKKPECRMGIDLQSNCSRQQQSSRNVNSGCNAPREGPLSPDVCARSIRGGLPVNNEIRLQEEPQPSPNVHYYRENEVHFRGGIGPGRRPPAYLHTSSGARYYGGNEELFGTGRVRQGRPPAYQQALQVSQYYNGGIVPYENGMVPQGGATAYSHISQHVRYDGSEVSSRGEGAVAVHLEMTEVDRLNARVGEGTSDSDTSRNTIDTPRIVADSGASPGDKESSSPNEEAETTSSDSMSSSVFFRLKKLLLYICCCVSRSRVLYDHKQGVSEQSADVYLENLKRIIKFAVKDAMIGEKMKQAKYQPLVDFVNNDE